MRRACSVLVPVMFVGIAMFGFGCNRSEPPGDVPAADVTLHVPAMN